jgi:hypothetical protein
MNVPKCPRCKEKYVTSKARYFCKKEGIEEEPVCLYCLAQLTGKRIGSTGMLDVGQTTPTVSSPYREQTIQKSVEGCRPCAQRRRMFR